MTAIWPPGTPNPGSTQAGEQGCTCAVLDNCHGRFAPFPPDDWYVTEGCPLHWQDEPADAIDDAFQED